MPTSRKRIIVKKPGDKRIDYFRLTIDYYSLFSTPEPEWSYESLQFPLSYFW